MCRGEYISPDSTAVATPPRIPVVPCLLLPAYIYVVLDVDHDPDLELNPFRPPSQPPPQPEAPPRPFIFTFRPRLERGCRGYGACEGYGGLWTVGIMDIAVADKHPEHKGGLAWMHNMDMRDQWDSARGMCGLCRGEYISSHRTAVATPPGIPVMLDYFSLPIFTLTLSLTHKEALTWMHNMDMQDQWDSGREMCGLCGAGVYFLPSHPGCYTPRGTGQALLTSTCLY